MDIQSIVLILLLCFSLCFGAYALISTSRKKEAIDPDEEEFYQDHYTEGEEKIRNARANEIWETRKEKKKL